MPPHSHCDGYYDNEKTENSVGDDVEASEALCAAEGNVNGAARGKQEDPLLEEAKSEFPCGPAVPLLGTSPKGLKAETQTGSVRSQSPQRYLRRPERRSDPRINKVTDTHTGECYSAFKRCKF